MIGSDVRGQRLEILRDLRVRCVDRRRPDNSPPSAREPLPVAILTMRARGSDRSQSRRGAPEQSQRKLRPTPKSCALTTASTPRASRSFLKG